MMRPEAEPVFVGGLLVGVWPLPRPGELELSNAWLCDVVDAIALVAEWSGKFPVDVVEVAATLRVVHGHNDGPERALHDLMLEFDRVDTRARALVPYLLLMRELEAATYLQVAAEEALYRALARHADAVERGQALARLLPVAA